MVANSSVILRKFKLKLDSNFWLPKVKLLRLLSLQRHHNTIELSDVVEAHSVLITVFQKFGPKLRSLKISNLKIDDFTLREVLQSSSHLEELFLSEVTIIRKLSTVNPINVVSLKSLTLQHCDWFIFKFFSKSQVTSLTINNYMNEGIRSYLVHFLSKQNGLKELTLHGTSSRVLFQHNDINENCNYNLNTFQMGRGFGRNSDSVNINIVNFLNLNAETLKNVEISVPNCEHISAFILTNLSNITSLTLDVRGLPRDNTFYQALVQEEPNQQLEALKLCGLFFQLKFIKIILMKYPAIKSLELDDWSNATSESDMLNFASVYFPNLQHLLITEISNGNNVRFAALKDLRVTNIRSIQNLINFIMMNRSVEALKIGFVYIGQISHFIEELLKLRHVHHLSFSGSETALRMILNLIHMDASKTVKTLELSLSYEKSRKAIKLFYPIDPYDYSLKCKALF